MPSLTMANVSSAFQKKPLSTTLKQLLFLVMPFKNFKKNTTTIKTKLKVNVKPLTKPLQPLQQPLQQKHKNLKTLKQTLHAPNKQSLTLQTLTKPLKQVFVSRKPFWQPQTKTLLKLLTLKKPLKKPSTKHKLQALLHAMLKKPLTKLLLKPKTLTRLLLTLRQLLKPLKLNVQNWNVTLKALSITLT